MLGKINYEVDTVTKVVTEIICLGVTGVVVGLVLIQIVLS